MKMLNGHIIFIFMSTARNFFSLPKQCVEGTPGVFAVIGAGDGVKEKGSRT